MGFLGLRYGPATRDRTDVRRISAARASWTLGFEELVRDSAFYAHTDFQAILWGSTEGDSALKAICALRCESGGKWNTVSENHNYRRRATRRSRPYARSVVKVVENGIQSQKITIIDGGRLGAQGHMRAPL